MTPSVLPFRAARCRGFSFTEILFAVMILGIGFIMVAAMFPVAIHQTEASNQETVATSLGLAGADVLGKAALVQFSYGGANPLASVFCPTTGMPTVTMPAGPAAVASIIFPGNVWSMYDPAHDTNPVHRQALWASVARNLIQQVDPRFAWIAMYRRDWIAQGPPGMPAIVTPAPYAQVIVIGVQSHNKPAYNKSSASALNDIRQFPIAGNLLPQYFSPVVLTPPSAANPFSTIQFRSIGPGQAVAEGSYVIISYDGLNGQYNGRVYRLGVADPVAVNQWQFIPGQGMSSGDPKLNNANVFLVGPGYDSSNPALKIHGPSEAISAFSTYIPIPN